FNHPPRLRADVVAQNDSAHERPFHKPDFREARVRRVDLGDGLGMFALSKPVAPAELANTSIPPPAQTQTGDGFKMLELDGFKLLLFAVPRDGSRQRMRRKFFQRVRKPRDLDRK